MQCFFFQLCDVAILAIIPQGDLAMFGYIDQKFNKIHLYPGYLLEQFVETWKWFRRKRN
jgi:hypothetical protein